MGRFYPEPVALSDEDEARLEVLSAEHDALAEGYSSYDEMPEDLAEKLQAMSDEIDTISARRSAYDPKVIANGGVFVILKHDGTARIERGFVRPEDEALADPQPEPEAEGDAVTGEDERPEEGDEDVPEREEEDEDTSATDPLLIELRRCQSIGAAGASDPDCLRAWAENRRRFLAPGARPASHIADGATPQEN